MNLPTPSAAGPGVGSSPFTVSKKEKKEWMNETGDVGVHMFCESLRDQILFLTHRRIF